MNLLRDYTETLSEENDSLLVLGHNKKDGDCTISLFGDWERLSMLFSQEGYVNLNENNKEMYNDIKKTLLNIAYNICVTDEDSKTVFLNGLTKVLTVKADKKGNVDCPFCKEKHKHGAGGGNGNRTPDCTTPLINNPVNGKHYKKDGYYVIFE